MKKVVMLTHDQIIDRRIISEANTLGANGYEVVIIAGPDDNKLDDNHDLVVGVSIKRVDLGLLQSNLLRTVKRNKKFKALVLKLISSQHKHKVLGLIFKFVSYLNGRSNISTIIYRDIDDEELLTDPLYNKDYSDAYWLSPLYFKYAIEEKADIYHCHDLTMLPSGYKASRLFNAKLVYDSHEYYPESVLAFTPEQKEYAEILFDVEQKLLPKTDIAITINDYLAETMAKRYNVPKLNVIQNCTQAPEELDYNIRYNIIREKLGLSENTKIVLFQGGFSEKRNLENLVLTGNHILDDDIVIVLLGYGDYGIYLKKLMKENDVSEDKVIFMEAVSQKELIYYSASADVGIIPYIAYNWYFSYSSPNKLYEFIQGALPIIASDQMTEIGRILKLEGIGIVGDLTSPEKIAAMIKYFFSDKSIKDKLKENMKKAAKKYIWKEEGTRLVDMYNRLY